MREAGIAPSAPRDEPHCWRGGALHVTVLCTDTEIALRQGALTLLPPAVAGVDPIHQRERPKEMS